MLCATFTRTRCGGSRSARRITPGSLDVDERVAGRPKARRTVDVELDPPLPPERRGLKMRGTLVTSGRLGDYFSLLCIIAKSAPRLAPLRLNLILTLPLLCPSINTATRAIRRLNSDSSKPGSRNRTTYAPVVSPGRGAGTRKIAAWRRPGT